MLLNKSFYLLKLKAMGEISGKGQELFKKKRSLTEVLKGDAGSEEKGGGSFERKKGEEIETGKKKEKNLLKVGRGK